MKDEQGYELCARCRCRLDGYKLIDDAGYCTSCFEMRQRELSARRKKEKNAPQR